MRKNWSLLLIGGLLFSCVNEKDLYFEGSQEYASTFSNVTAINVDITSAYDGSYYAIFYEFPYVDGDLVKEPFFTGTTPIKYTLEVPKDVKNLYVVGNGTMKTFKVGDISIAETRATISTNAIDSKVVEYINGTCFPEASYNVRSENLHKCTDLVIAASSETGDFNEADVWTTFIGDGGFSLSSQYGYLWFYTYPASKLKAGMTRNDVQFYGLSKTTGEIIQVSYSDIQNMRNYLFYSKEEIVSGASSFKKVHLGTFEKNLNIGFVFWNGTTGAQIRFSTPYLNPIIEKKTLTYSTNSSYTITNKYVANGFIRHIQVADSKGGIFEGNVLGMENRAPSENNYDGDYNDMLCLIESNPIALKPAEVIDNPAPVEFTTKKGVYLFEDNYPERGDYDFNDAVIEYSIVDFYKSSNKAKQVSARCWLKDVPLIIRLVLKMATLILRLLPVFKVFPM